MNVLATWTAQVSSICLASALTLASAHAQGPEAEHITNMEYQGGHSGMDKKVKGTLVIEADTVRFLSNKDSTLIALPIIEFTEASNSEDRKDASVGSKIAFGFLARSRKEEYVTLAYESSETAEAVVFRAPKNMSAGIVAKIRFRMKRLGLATDSVSTAAVRVPSGSGAVKQ